MQHILIVDDAADNLPLLEKLLSDNGYGVRTPLNGAETSRDLAEREEHFRLFIMECPIPIAVSNLGGNIELLNNRFVASFGYTLDDVPSVDVWLQRAYPEPDYREHVCTEWDNAMENALRSDGVIHNHEEFKITCKDGTFRFA